MLVRITTVVGIVLLSVLAVLRVARPPAPVAATAPDTVFSTERALQQVEEIAVKPHPVGTPEHDRVRDHIFGELASLGLRPQIQRATAIGTRYQDAGQIQNILAWLPGSTPNGKAVLLVAHYDGVGAGPAAADDGAGSAALLETMRALRARKKPLAHDVIALFSDGEESGLLGAAAFAREHAWAKDVAVVLNFDARGTTGRSFMFETGPGNLDAARALRAAGDVSAGSVFTTIYRMLHNDTDLSELAILGTPALNFAFADGIERYHTARDDMSHLNPGSLQHHGEQMLALAKIFGDGELPRPKTADGVFFDMPAIGLIVYPEWLSVPLAVLALIMVGVLIWRVRAGVAAGAGFSLLLIVSSGCAAWAAGAIIKGAGRWSGLNAIGIVLLVVSIGALCRRIASRWSNDRGLLAGGLAVLAVLAVSISIVAPGTGYLLTWPVMFGAGAALSWRGHAVLEWLSAAIVLLILAGFSYGASVVMLGLTGAGAIALGVLSAVIVIVLLPQFSHIEEEAHWSGAAWPAGGAFVMFAIAGAIVHTDADHPARSSLVYAWHVDSSDAWLGSSSGLNDEWTRSVIGAPAPVPTWVSHTLEFGGSLPGKRVPRVPLDGPNATVARDTTINGLRRVVLRVTAPKGATNLLMRASGTRVATASIDGRIVDTARYRYKTPDWLMDYYAVPDTGAIVALSIPLGAKLNFELASSSPGLPPVPGLVIPVRPSNVVPSQDGDVTVVYRHLIF
jgi:hypothetical protein